MVKPHECAVPNKLGNEMVRYSLEMRRREDKKLLCNIWGRGLLMEMDR